VGCSSKKEGLNETKREIWQKEKGKKEKRTHRSSVGREKIGQGSPIIGPLVTISHITSHDKQK